MLRQKITYIVRGLLFLYILGSRGVFSLQEKLLFHPSISYTNIANYEEIMIEGVHETYAGLQYIDASCDKVIIFFHGNAGNVSSNKASYELFQTLGMCFVALDYPEFGKSTGSLDSLQDLLDVGEAAFIYAENQGFNTEDIIARGYSIGGGIASYVAEKYNLPLLVLQSSYTSVATLVKKQFGIFPIDLLLKYKLDNLQHLKNYTGKLIVIHGKADTVIPFTHGENVYNTYENEKYFIIHEGGHQPIPLSLVSEIKKIID